MMRAIRSYPVELRQQVIAQYRPGDSIERLASNYGIPQATVRNWLRKAGTYTLKRQRRPQEIREHALSLYKSGLTTERVAAITGIPQGTIAGWITRARLWRDRSKSRRIYPDWMREYAISHYQKGDSSIQIAKALGISHERVLRWLRYHHVPRRTRSDAQHLRHGTWVRRDAFSPSALTEVGAYWLGFIAADGCVQGNTVSVGVKKHDGHHLDSLAAWLGGKAAHHYKGHLSRFQVGSPDIVRDLAYWGIVERKSFRLQWPEGLPAHLIRDFIRGYVDGDGSFCVAGRNWWSYTFQVIGTPPFIEHLATIVRLACNVGGTISIRHYSQPMAQFYVGGRRQVARIHHWLYDNACVALDRKAKPLPGLYD